MQTASEVESKIRAKADEDEAFRAKLLQDPRSAIKEATGLTLPEGFTVHVHEESASDFHMVLPPVGGRISDHELRDVSGGFGTGTGYW